MSDLRTKLFLSYSNADARWCDLFRRHLRTLVSPDELWIDRSAIPAGSPFAPEITEGIAKARCALILVTPSYLDQGNFARSELDALVAEQARGLTLLPVLVEECAWPSVPALARLQFVRWQGDKWFVEAETGPRAALRPLKGAGEFEDRAVIEICDVVKKTLGVVAQATPVQIDEMVAGIRQSLGNDVELEAVHSGDFSVVYRARRGDDVFAVKAVPDAPRQNRIRAIVDAEMPKVMALRDRAFIRMRDVHRKYEPHCLVMDYVDGPTLDVRLAAQPNRRLEPGRVAKLLAQVAHAQREAHLHALQIGPMKPSSIHVDDDWQVRLSPLRVEGVLARAGYMAGGQLLNWDALTHLAPETSQGRELQPKDFDALEQYYLALLGLQLLLGRPACEVRCFDDLLSKARFFDDPRSFFNGGGDSNWADEGPALSFLLARMLARDPAQRLPDSAIEELQAVAAGRLPPSVRAQLNDDLDEVMAPAFAAGFYDRLFKARAHWADRFGKGREAQAQMLAQAIPALIDFDPQGSRRGGFKAVAESHARLGIEAPDIEAFRLAFLAQLDTVFGTTGGHHDAWNAALRLGLAHLSARLAPEPPLA
jgi:hemoglobin-like flavoprotein